MRWFKWVLLDSEQTYTCLFCLFLLNMTLQPFSVACGIGLKVFWMWCTSKRVRQGPWKLVHVIIMPSFISNNLKAHIPALHYEQGFSVKRICSTLNVRKTLAYEILCHHHTHGVAFDLNAQ